MKTTDKDLRAILDGCEIEGQWSMAYGGVYERGAQVAQLWGGKYRFARAELVAMAPELAREVLALRREVRRLRKQVP